MTLRDGRSFDRSKKYLIAFNSFDSRSAGHHFMKLRALLETQSAKSVMHPVQTRDALIDYFGLSDQQIATAAERMIHDGKHELAAAVLQWSRGRSAGSAPLAAARKLAYLKLMEKYQEFNSFKFIVYGAARRRNRSHRSTRRVPGND